ncbi:MAG TPA: glycine oxidase ThiO [Xanthobacteraceae bacterium]|nr:glycine oxidase ThiO [Xanthobacteraceae bacterium]
MTGPNASISPVAAASAAKPPAGKRPRVVIIGAGVIGLGIAWRLAPRAEVVLYDRGPAGAGSSHAAAGMLAAACEAEPGEEDLVMLGRDSQARWPGFAAELLRASGVDVELRTEGTLLLALTADDQATLTHHLDFQRKLGLPLDWLSPAATRAKEPHLAGKIAGAIFSPEDHQVDNRKLVTALRIAAEAAGATIHEHQPVKEIASQGGRATGVVLADGTSIAADRVVLAAGAWSRGIAGLPPDRRPPVRPVKGQMLALRMDANAPLLNHVLWAPGAYLVPRRDGRLIIGATVEEKGFDETITAGGLLTLLEAAWRAIPAVEELPVDEIWVGHRPGSRDDAPVLGRAPLENLFYATGHHRNGILLAPITADAMARLILDDALEPAIKPFGLERFLPARAAE